MAAELCRKILPQSSFGTNAPGMPMAPQSGRLLTLLLCQDLPKLPPADSPLNAATNGLEFFEKLQLPSGHWGCEYGGPMFLLPGLVYTWYITKTPIPSARATEIKNYLTARAHPEDGGWGLHIEGESSVFGIVLNYMVLAPHRGGT